MSEEDQMMRAIAMSLGQEVSMEQRSDSPEVGIHTHSVTCISEAGSTEQHSLGLTCVFHIDLVKLFWHVSRATNQTTVTLCHQEAARRREEEERRARERVEEEEARCLERFLEAEPLDTTELHSFTDSMLPGCFHLLDELPDTIYRLCDLLMTAIKRNGPEYRDLILRQVVNQVSAQKCLFLPKNYT